MSLKALLSSPLPLGSSELFLSLAFAVLISLSLPSRTGLGSMRSEAPYGAERPLKEEERKL